MYEDKSIRISAGTYKLLKDLKEKTGLPIKRIIHNFVVEAILYKKGNNK